MYRFAGSKGATNFSGLAGMSYILEFKHNRPGIKILMLSAEDGTKRCNS
jgi:hypothetical protein